MDIKEQVEQVIGSITKDPSKISSFKDDPAAAVKNILGDKIPEDVIQKIIEEVKKNLSPEKLSEIMDALGKLFKK